MDRPEEKNIYGENAEFDAQTEEKNVGAESQDEGSEHVISYREDEETADAEVKSTPKCEDKKDSSGEYHLTGREVPKDTLTRYDTYHTVQSGDISYTPVKEKKEKRETKNKGSSLGGRIVLVAVCVLLSLGCGFIGAYFGTELASVDGAGVGSTVGGGTNGGTVVVV